MVMVPEMLFTVTEAIGFAYGGNDLNRVFPTPGSAAIRSTDGVQPDTARVDRVNSNRGMSLNEVSSWVIRQRAGIGCGWSEIAPLWLR